MTAAQSLIICLHISSGVMSSQKPFGGGVPQRTPGPWPGRGAEAPPARVTP
jgi:hypothetical protein